MVDLEIGYHSCRTFGRYTGNPGDYIESQKFFSWENFFEDFLVQETRRTPFQYAKSNLNDVYKQKANQKRIAAEIMDVD